MDDTDFSPNAPKLDPEFEVLLTGSPDFSSGKQFLEKIRGAIPGLGTTDRVVRTEHTVDEGLGITVRIHRAQGVSGELPCIFSIHGGGYIMGSPAMDDLDFESWCPTLGVVGASIDYRWAPEVPFPGPLEDCYLGLEWIFENADDLGIDEQKVGVYGPSAGGGLAAALALLTRDRGKLPLSFQMLQSPMLDDRQMTPSSRTKGLAVWSGEANEFGWRSYLGDLYGTADVPYLAAPSRALDLSGLPRTFISATGADGFRDEDIDYALRLQQAGVETELHVYPGAPHGYQLLAASRVAKQADRDAAEWLARVLR